jgi:hypothetical protein
MREPQYQTYRLEWYGLDIEVRYCPSWLVGGTVAHLEVESLCRSPLPFTETGYRSHFTQVAVIDEAGGPVAFVEAWLEADGSAETWKESVERRKQYSLF